MKRVTLLGLIAASSVLGCSEEGTSGPEILIDVSPVNLGVVAVDADAEHFDLQLTNRGDSTLLIDGWSLRGDQHCALEMTGPDVSEVSPGGSAFLRGWYGPSVVAEDQIELLITSNAVDYPELVVPVCGRGVDPADEDAEPPECELPDVDQLDCDEDAVVEPEPEPGDLELPETCQELPREDDGYAVYCDEELSWEAALSTCESLLLSLLTIDDEAENAWLEAALDDPIGLDDSGNLLWIGFNDRDEEGAWTWVSGADADFTQWKSGQPDDHSDGEDCGVFRASGNWNDLGCDEEMRFVCEAP